MIDRVRNSVDMAMVALLSTAKRREPAQGFIEFALLVVVLVAVASIGLAVLGTDLSTLFSDLGNKLKLPSGF
jgi:Flp pilus assembly pilin Flp